MKLLIVHGYEPSGHASAAVALEAQARERGLEVLRVNISADYHPVLGPLIAKAYLGLISRFPGLWRVFYDNASVAGVAGGWQQAYLRLGGRRLAARLKEIDPDTVVCTSAPPMAAIALAKQREGLTWPLVAALTDYHAHGYWLKPMADLYLAASAESASQLAARGIPANRIKVTGIPVHPAFNKPATTKREKGPALLVSGGSRGLGRLGDVCAALLSLPGARISVLCGSNAAQRRALSRRFSGEPRVQAHPALSPDGVRELMESADLLVGRAGGITAAEAMALGLPMLIFEPVPGQEARNALYLTRNGAAVAAPSLSVLANLAAELLKPGALDSMRRRAKALGKPDSAAIAIEAILALRP